MLKVSPTERLWEAINEAFQIYGGSAYFVDLPGANGAHAPHQSDRRRQQRSAHTFISIAHRSDARPGMEFKEILRQAIVETIARSGQGVDGRHAKARRCGAHSRVPLRSAETFFLRRQVA